MIAIVFLLQLFAKLEGNYVLIGALISTIVLFIYVWSVSKKTERGIEHYTQWKAFKKFLLDFGRFDEKELPEIVLWDLYLVYATVLGIADKVSKSMEIKIKQLNETNPDLGNVLITNMYLNTMFTSNLSKTISNVKTQSVSKIADRKSVV